MSLTDKECKLAASIDKNYKLADEKGMFLLVTKKGSKYSHLKYRFAGKEKLLSLGIYPEVTLKEAREKRFNVRKLWKVRSIIAPKVTSESRPYLPVGILTSHSIISDNAFALYDAPLWNMALIASRIHLIWISTVCGKMKTDFRYSNTLGWNTFPVPLLTEQNKADLTACAENILLAREVHFPAIADLYDPDKMPENLRHAHERNDEVLERIYISRRFKNDTERLEKLFELYTKMTAAAKFKPATKQSKASKSHE